MGILDQAVIPVKRKSMKQFIKKIFGIDKIEEESAKAIKELEEIKAAAAPKTPKEIATENREPWVAVLDTHVNKDNIRNGFFELDWNEYFVLQLRAAGYAGDTDEAIVDQWFSELCRSVGGDEGVDMSRRGAGYINVNNLGNGRTEVS
jgi:hypothetical protein